MKIQEEIEYIVKNSNSRITFEKTGGSTWKIWDRFISIDKQKLYHIGNVCGTCEFFFLKQETSLEPNFNKDILIELLNSGELSFDINSVEQLSRIIPNGNYRVLNCEINPNIVTSTSTNDYFTKEQRRAWRSDIDNESQKIDKEFNNYYREEMIDFGKLKGNYKNGFFNFFIPLYDTRNLNQERVEFYKKRIEEGGKPIILAIGILDVKSSEEFPIQDDKEIKPEFRTHWCLANYIVDGHHKIKAASELDKPIKMISFVSRDESWKMIDEMIKELKTMVR